MSTVRAALALLALAPASGCMAARAGWNMWEAEKVYREASAAGAETSAVYEYTLATEYRRKSLEEWGYSDYWAAHDLSRKAFEYAAAATDVARFGAEEREILKDMEGTEGLVPDEVESAPTPPTPPPTEPAPGTEGWEPDAPEPDEEEMNKVIEGGGQ